MPEPLANLEKLLGYRFQNLALLERAVTHRSWAYEKIPSGEEIEIRGLQNESFEFVGDSVLGLAVAEQLFVRHPSASEGDLTLMKHHLVSTGTLLKIARNLNLGKFMRVGRVNRRCWRTLWKLLLPPSFLTAVIFRFAHSLTAFLQTSFATLRRKLRLTIKHCFRKRSKP
jgi:hypothetical protein